LSLGLVGVRGTAVPVSAAKAASQRADDLLFADENVGALLPTTAGGGLLIFTDPKELLFTTKKTAAGSYGATPARLLLPVSGGFLAPDTRFRAARKAVALGGLLLAPEHFTRQLEGKAATR